MVTEWERIDLANPAETGMLMLGLIALIVAARRHDVVFTAAIGVTVIGSGVAIRMLPVLLLLALPVLAAFASHPVILRYLRSRRRVLIPGAAAVIGVLAVMMFLNLGDVIRQDPRCRATGGATGRRRRRCRTG